MLLMQVGDELQPQLLQPLQRVAWCPIDPSPTDVAAAAAQYPLYFDPDLPTPLRVEVNAGQCLYLPAMWYHYVEQRCDAEQGWCVAVNYWYDMRFDLKYAAYELVEKLAQDVGLVPLLPPSEQSPEEFLRRGCI
jgi:jumonji domain-containing protein 7